MRELTDPKWMYLKAVLFLLLGFGCAVLLFMEQPTVRFGVLLAVAVWSFCRFYYFAFYVVERYVDPTYRFSGLVSLVRYFLAKRRKAP
jgi:hypothetical protein